MFDLVLFYLINVYSATSFFCFLRGLAFVRVLLMKPDDAINYIYPSVDRITDVVC